MFVHYFDLVSGPGDSSCDIAATYCNETTFWNQYPDGCLSFVFCCLYIDEKQTINFMFESAHNGYLIILNRLQ